MNVADKIQDLQARLSRAAKQTLDRKFGALYDNGVVRDRLRIFWKRKHNVETRGLGRLSGKTLAKLGLYQFAYAKT